MFKKECMTIKQNMIATYDKCGQKYLLLLVVLHQADLPVNMNGMMVKLTLTSLL